MCGDLRPHTDAVRGAGVCNGHSVWRLRFFGCRIPDAAAMRLRFLCISWEKSLQPPYMVVQKNVEKIFEKMQKNACNFCRFAV